HHGRDRLCLFFFQAEDGIRDDLVTGVQTCALPISTGTCSKVAPIMDTLSNARGIGTSATSGTPWGFPFRRSRARSALISTRSTEIGRASCRERERVSEVGRGR